jgi:hypothetical protein
MILNDYWCYMCAYRINHHTIKTYAEWRYSATVPGLGTRKTMVSVTSRQFYPKGTSSWHLWDRSVDGPQSQFEPYGL